MDGGKEIECEKVKGLRLCLNNNVNSAWSGNYYLRMHTEEGTETHQESGVIVFQEAHQSIRPSF